MFAMRAFLLLGMLSVVSSQAQAAEPASTLVAADVFRLAELARVQGRLGDSETLLKGLLADLRADYRAEARFRLGRLREQQGDLDGAAGWYQHLLREQPEAQGVRLELARVLTALGRTKDANIQLDWLGSVGLPNEIAQLVGGTPAGLHSRRRIGATMGLALAPDTNVNRASSAETIGTVFGPLQPDADARARSGVGLAMHAQGFARPTIGRVPVLVRLSVQADLYRRGDFNDVAVSGLIGPELTLFAGRTRPALLVTQRAFGGTVYSRHAGVSLNWERIVGWRTRVEAEMVLADGRYRNRLQSGRLINFKANAQRALTRTMSGRASLQLTRSTARDPGYALTSAGVAVVLAWKLGGHTMLVEGGGSILGADRRLALFARRRIDRQFDLGAAMLMPKWRQTGLTPLIRLRRSQSWSTVDIYDVKQTRLEVGLSYEF